MRRSETRQQQPTFKNILERAAGENAERLLERARTANRLAKIVTNSHSRRRAYRVKTDALHRLRESFPAQTRVFTDARIPSFVVVQYNTGTTRPRSLHAPAAEFACS